MTIRIVRQYVALHIALLLTSLVLVGCGLLTERTPPPPPAWYSHPAAEPSGVWWGYGSGPTKQQATQKALLDIAARIKTTVSEELRVQTGRYDERTRQTLNQLTRQTVDQTEFQGYQVREYVQVGKHDHYVQAEVSQATFLARQWARLQTINGQLAPMMTAFASESAAARIKRIPPIRAQLDRGRGLAEVLATFGHEPTATAALATRYNDYDQQLIQARDAIQCYIHHDPASRYIAQHLHDLLTAADLPIATYWGDPRRTIGLSIASEVKEYTRGSETRVTLTTRFVVEGAPGEQVATRQETVSAASLKGADKALESASALLREAIEGQGILGFLGL